MRKYILPITFVLLVTSCTIEREVIVDYEEETYTEYEEVEVYFKNLYYFNSDSLNDNFLYRNNDLKVEYSFVIAAEDNAEYFIKVKVTNISEKSLYLDKSQSSVIFNGESNPYTDYVTNWKTEIIPPSSYTEFLIPDIRLRKILPPVNSVARRDFNSDNSPLFLRNFMTYSFSKDLKDSRNVDNDIFLETFISCVSIDCKEIIDNRRVVVINSKGYKVKERTRTERYPITETEKEFDLTSTIFLGAIVITVAAAVVIGVF